MAAERKRRMKMLYEVRLSCLAREVAFQLLAGSTYKKFEPSLTLQLPGRRNEQRTPRSLQRKGGRSRNRSNKVDDQRRNLFVVVTLRRRPHSCGTPLQQREAGDTRTIVSFEDAVSVGARGPDLNVFDDLAGALDASSVWIWHAARCAFSASRRPRLPIAAVENSDS